jgi:PPP family 3-phenylpropionic acid transporter
MENPTLKSRFILASQYFMYFGIMGVFLPYFNLHCYKLGFSSFQIGVLSASRSIIMVLSPLLLSFLADRFKARKTIYLSCHILSAAIWSFYLFTSDFLAMLAITVCYTVFYSPIISFLETFTIDILGSRKKSYGTVRVWGTVAFIITVSIMGKILGDRPVGIIIPLILAGSVIHVLLAFNIPDTRPKEGKPFLREALALLKNRRAVFFLSSAFLMLVSHGAYYGFFSIHLENIGYGPVFIGAAWAVASIAEIVVLMNSDKIFRRFTIENVVVFSFAAAVARWLVLSMVRSPALIMLSQVLHAATYGAFHMSSILYIDSMTPEETKTLGQSLNNAVTYGLGLMVGFFLSGWIYGQAGCFVLFAFSSLVALTGGIFFRIFKAAD